MREPCALPPTGPPCGPRTRDILGEGGGGMTPDVNSKGVGICGCDVSGVQERSYMRKIKIIPLDKRTLLIGSMTSSQ